MDTFAAAKSIEHVLFTRARQYVRCRRAILGGARDVGDVQREGLFERQPALLGYAPSGAKSCELALFDLTIVCFVPYRYDRSKSFE